MSDLCKCGHAEDHHFTPRLGGRCFRHECECLAFEAPNADRDDLAAILAKHDDWINNQDGTQAICDCQSVISTSNSWTECEEAHRAHVAQMVLESNWLRDVKAQAWDEGYKRGAADWAAVNLKALEVAIAPNPYRTTEEAP